MEVNINSIHVNPENPRKISNSQLEKLIISILTFAPMLKVRWIVVNEDNIVLAGNQRLTALKAIASYDRAEIEEILTQNDRYSSLDDKGRIALVDSWVEWGKNPMVEVRQVNLSEDEQHELMLKDNVSFGEYDYTLLEDMFSSEELVEMGFDSDCFYKAEQDEGAMVVVEGSAPRRIDTLKFGEYSCEISKEEYNRLESIYSNFVECTGTAYGFITSMKNGVCKD